MLGRCLNIIKAKIRSEVSAAWLLLLLLLESFITFLILFEMTSYQGRWEAALHIFKEEGALYFVLINLMADIFA